LLGFLHHAIRAFRGLQPASALLMLAGFAGSAFYGIVWFVVPIAISRAEGSGIPGIGLGVFDLAIVLVGAFMGRLADRTNRQRLIFFGLLLFAAAGAALGFSAGIWFLVLGFLATIGDELASTSLWAWLYHLDKDHAEDAVVAASISMVNDLGWTVGPLVAGFLLTPLGSTWTIVVGAGFIFVAWVAYAVILGPRRALALAVIPRAPSPRPHRRRHKR
jgi:MFS family permease